MALRGLAGDMARNTSGLWKGIADALDPDGSPPPSRPTDADIDLTEAGPMMGERGGNMIVPIDTWTRILEQVGNVHEAGQQLAEARERAARAETENRFLKEQLAELKAQRPADARRRPAAPATPADDTDPAPEPPTSASRPAPTPSGAPDAAAAPSDTSPEPIGTSEVTPPSRNPLRRPAVERRISRVRRRASDWLSPS